MSLAIPVPLEKYLVVDPLCDVSTQSFYAVEKSASTANYYQISSNNSSNSSTTWVINCNDSTTITSRVFFVDMLIDVTVPVARASLTNANANSICLRAFPLSQWANSIVLQIGNAQTVIQSSQIASALHRYGFYDKWINYSECPVQLDLDTPYAATFNGPFGLYSSTVGEKFSSRGSYCIENVSWNVGAAADTEVTIRYRIVEPVLISPLLSSLSQNERKQGMRKLSQLQLTYNWSTSGARVVSTLFEPTAPVRVAVSGSPNLRVQQLIPGVADIGRSLSVQSLPYSDFVPYSTAPKFIANRADNKVRLGGIQTFNSATIQLSRIPSEIYIYCRPTDAFMQEHANATDTFATYVDGSLQINMNGQQQFQNISDIQLYHRCVENGINTTWGQWSSRLNNGINYVAVPVEKNYASGVGSVICLKMGKDITLGVDLAPGVNTKVNLDVQCQFNNNYINAAPYDVDGGVPFTMYVVVAYEGCMEIYQNNTVQTTLGCLSTEDVLTAIKRNEKVHYDVVNNNAYGGSIFSKIRNFISEGKLSEFIKKFKNVFSHPLTKEIGKTAKDFLRNREGADGKSQIADVLEEMGAGQSGGRRMTKAELKRALLG
jgi:hypothetical protein